MHHGSTSAHVADHLLLLITRSLLAFAFQRWIARSVADTSRNLPHRSTPPRKTAVSDQIDCPTQFADSQERDLRPARSGTMCGCMSADRPSTTLPTSAMRAPSSYSTCCFACLREVYGIEHVTYARNITDVDDKINARAAQEHPDLPLNQAIALVTEKNDQTVPRGHCSAWCSGADSRAACHRPHQPDARYHRATCNLE